jgi:uncharacterized protein
MHYDGSFEVSASKEVCYAFATDPAKITTIFPDVQEVKVIDFENFELKTKIGISFIKGTMDVKGTIAEKIPSKFVKLKAKANGLSSSIQLESSFTMEDGVNDSTVIKWTADAIIGGLITRVGSRLMDSAAQKYIDQIIVSLKQKLSSDPEAIVQQ